MNVGPLGAAHIVAFQDVSCQAKLEPFKLKVWRSGYFLLQNNQRILKVGEGLRSR